MSLGEAPRLLYLADVPVESTYHGSALLYRLLESYPRERLAIVDGAIHPAHLDRRLEGVRHAQLAFARRRLLDSRLHRAYSLWLSLRSGAWTGRVAPLLGGFDPQAVLTVAHGHLWVTAARFAEERGLPLHLVAHDDWPRIVRPPAPFSDFVEHQFAEVYRQATSRLCVSPYMSEEFARRYGVAGDVLYPSRSGDEHPAPVPARSRGALTFAFAGTINTPGYWQLVRSLAEGLAPTGGRLLLFGPMTADAARAAGLDSPDVDLRGLVPSERLIDRLREEADVLFVPMSFAASDRTNMELAFPSKLADYTAAGLPLFVWGPPYCSAVRWVREHAGVAEVVDSEAGDGLREALARLEEPAHRDRLAAQAVAAGDRCFSRSAAQRIFRAAIARGASAVPAAGLASA